MNIDLDDVNPCEIYEINELYNTGNPNLIDIAQQIKEASAKAMKECTEKDNSDFSIIGEIELKGIKSEEKSKKNQKKYAKNITKAILQTNHGYWPNPNDTNKIRLRNDKEAKLIYPKIVHHIIKDEQYKQTIQKVIDQNTIDN